MNGIDQPNTATKLNLRSQNLTSLPNEIYSMFNLSSLDLAFNQIELIDDRIIGCNLVEIIIDKQQIHLVNDINRYIKGCMIVVL